MSVCPSSDRDSFNPTVSSMATADIPSYSDTDSAVSLPVHCKHRYVIDHAHAYSSCIFINK